MLPIKVTVDNKEEVDLEILSDPTSPNSSNTTQTTNWQASQTGTNTNNVNLTSDLVEKIGDLLSVRLVKLFDEKVGAFSNYWRLKSL